MTETEAKKIVRNILDNAQATYSAKIEMIARLIVYKELPKL